MTDPVLPRPGQIVALRDGKGSRGRVRSVDKMNLVVRVYFGTSEHGEVIRDVHVHDLNLNVAV